MQQYKGKRLSAAVRCICQIFTSNVDTKLTNMFTLSRHLRSILLYVQLPHVCFTRQSCNYEGCITANTSHLQRCVCSRGRCKTDDVTEEYGDRLVPFRLDCLARLQLVGHVSTRIQRTGCMHQLATVKTNLEYTHFPYTERVN